MPANLNALIRYKTIDRCLRNRFIRCDIRRLQEECSEALGESRGRTTKVSERTIRDDIRVMKSDILEFNAPILFLDGYYIYSNPDYSIFNISPKNKQVIQQVIDLLWKNKDVIDAPDFFSIMNELHNMIKSEEVVKSTLSQPPIEFYIPEEGMLLIKEAENIEEQEDDEEDVIVAESTARMEEPDHKSSIVIKEIMYSFKAQSPAITWGAILKMI